MIFALLLSQAGLADAPRWRDPPECWDGAQSELTHCAWTEYQTADEELNKQWRASLAVLERLDDESPYLEARTVRGDRFDSPSRVEAVRVSQRAWIVARDNYCKLPLADGGSMAPMLQYICLRDLTKKRTQQIAALAMNPVSGQPYFKDK